MSEVHWLRHTLLVALGIPAASLTTLACGSGGSDPETPREPVVRRADPSPGEVAALDPSCVEPGYVCVYDERGCAPTASGHTQTSYTGKYKGEDWGPEAFNGQSLVFDPVKTKATRAEAFPGQEPLNYCCYTGCPAYDEADLSRAEPAPPSDIISCVVPAPKVAFPATDAPQCSAAMRVDGTYRAFLKLSGERCCYPTGRSRGDLGRPLREAGHASAVTSVKPAGQPPARDGGVIDVARYTTEAQAHLARTWHEAALLEHASVAAFAKVSLELLAFGAPADLVRDAHEAAIDELAHAALCTEIARAFGGAAIPGPHPAASRVVPLTDLAAFVRETIDDGCIGETIAALEAKEAAHEADDPALARAYETIAADEARHAALAFRIVQWAVGVDPSMGAVVALALDVAEARGARADAIRGAVRPCIEAILADPGAIA